MDLALEICREAFIRLDSLNRWARKAALWTIFLRLKTRCLIYETLLSYFTAATRALMRLYGARRTGILQGLVPLMH